MDHATHNQPPAKRGRPQGAKTAPDRTPARQTITAARRATFLKTLRDVGIFQWAAVAASPNAKTRSGAQSSFRALMARDPEFREQVEEAQAEADAKLEREALRRAVDGCPRYVFQKGELMHGPDGKPAVVHEYSDRLMEVLLRSRVPDRFGERKLRVEHSGSVHHAHGHFVISPDELLALSPEQRAHLRGIVQTLAQARGERIESAALPAPTQEAIDVDYEQVAEEEDYSPAALQEIL